MHSLAECRKANNTQPATTQAGLEALESCGIPAMKFPSCRNPTVDLLHVIWAPYPERRLSVQVLKNAKSYSVASEEPQLPISWNDLSVVRYTNTDFLNMCAPHEHALLAWPDRAHEQLLMDTS
jgi:hypothetical protein